MEILIKKMRISILIFGSFFIQQKEQNREDAETMLKNYWEYIQRKPVKKLYTEHGFSFKTEYAILSGKCDRIDLDEDNNISIIDYKTSKNPKTERELKKDIPGDDLPGIYGKCDNDEACIEKGSADNRSFINEFEKMIYNVGLEYWYTDNFALRAGYIYDDEGKVINPTFGAGIRLLQYGFDFGYTAGTQGHPRANTMFFSINMKL